MGPALWLAMARDELRAAELLGEHGIAPLSCLHADQAVEKALWAFHLYRVGHEATEARGRVPMDGAAETERQAEKRPPAAAAATSSALAPTGARPRGIAAALASLALESARRRSARINGSGDHPAAEGELAREAVQVARELLDRITDRVYPNG